MKAGLAAVVLRAAFPACAPPAPKLVVPDSIESFCPGPPPKGGAIVSILSSVADAITPIDVPRDDALRSHVSEAGGVIAHWKTEPLYMPGTAKAIGVSGDYIDVSEVDIANDLADSESRIIYVTVATPAGPKRLGLRAYDIRNVCTATATPEP